MTNENQRSLNEEFIEQVTQQGVTMYDHYGSAVYHTTDLNLVADFLVSTGERHNGPGLGGKHPAFTV